MNAKIREWLTSTTTILGAIAAAAAGLVALAENVEKVVHAKAVLYVFVFADFLFWELLFLSAVILGRGVLLGQLRALRVGYQLIRSRKSVERRFAWYSHLATAVLVASAGVVLYFGIRYGVAKAQFRKRYPAIIAARAVDAFQSGQTHRARFYLRVGSEVLRSEDFTMALEFFDKRMAEAAKLRTVLAKLPAASTHRGELIKTIELLDQRHDDATAARAAEKARLNHLRKTYEEGAAAVHRGDFATARARFLDVFQRYPSFGDVHRVIAELDRLNRTGGQISASTMPYLASFRRGDRFVLNALTHPPVSVLAEGTTLLPVEDESEENE